jgi:hypothetical protein
MTESVTTLSLADNEDPLYLFFLPFLRERNTVPHITRREKFRRNRKVSFHVEYDITHRLSKAQILKTTVHVMCTIILRYFVFFIREI